MSSPKVKAGKLIFSLVLVCGLSVMLSVPIDIIPPLGGLIDPFRGIWSVALTADHPAYQVLVAPGLSAPVTVFRDPWGVPHIYAENDHDLYFAFGYVQAQDRLWQMDMQRRLARGLLSQVLGPGDDNSYLETDIFFRTIGLERAAQKTLEQLDLDSQMMQDLNAFMDGVNWYIATAGPNLPLEFKLLNYQPEPWTMIDTLSFAKFMAYTLSRSDADLRLAKVVDALGAEQADELFPLLPPLQIPVVPEYGTTYPPSQSTRESEDYHASSSMKVAIERQGLPSELSRAINDILSLTERLRDPLGLAQAWRISPFGSNNWAVNGSKSATGKPILCNDMHLSWSMPPIWYQAHLVSSSSGLNIYGFAFVGVPLIIVGHNEYLAWGFTNVGADVIDWVYYVTNPNDPNQYWYNGEWRDFEEEVVAIPLKGGGVHYATIRRTVHGPVLSRYGYTVAQLWVAQEPSFEVSAFYKMNRATNYQEFVEGQKDFWVPSQNMVYADVDGNIAIRPTGRIPIRSSGYGLLPVNGSAGEGEWTGYIPFDELPLSLNPERCYVASANQLAAGPAYPYHIHSHVAPGYRARRINHLLNTSSDITVEDMRRFQLDVVDAAAEAFIPFLLDAFDNASPPITDQLVVNAVEELRNWNYTMKSGLVAPTLWWAWWQYYYQGVFGDEYAQAGEEDLLWPSTIILENLTRFQPNSHWFDNVSSTAVETRDDIILSTFQQAVKAIAEKAGTDLNSWTWGSFHYVFYPHLANLDALSRGPYPSGGDAVTVNPSGGNMWADTPEGMASTHGASERLIVDFNDLITGCRSVIPGGQRGNPLSRHYDDQLQLFLNGQYHPEYLYAQAADFPDHLKESILIINPG